MKIPIPAVSSSHSPGTQQECPSLPCSAGPVPPHTACSAGPASLHTACSTSTAPHQHCMLSWSSPPSTPHTQMLQLHCTLHAQLVQPYIHTACSTPYIHTACSAGSSPPHIACSAGPAPHPPCILSWSSPTFTLYALLTAVPDSLHALVLLA